MGYLDNAGLAYFWEKIKSNFFPGTKEIPANVDLNDYRTPGLYACSANVTAQTISNVPIQAAFSLLVRRTASPSGDWEGCNQIITTNNSNRIWVRAYYKPQGWTAWCYLIDNCYTIDGVHIKQQHTTHYGVCSTAAATAVKTVDIPHFELVTGAYVIVKFTVTNSAAVANLKLNVSNTGGKPIKYRNDNLAESGDLVANRPFIFVYDGTNWQLGIDIDKSEPRATNSDIDSIFD